MPKLFADLHVHPGLYAFNRVRNHAEEENPATFNPWYVPADQDLHAMEKGERGRTYAQADVPKLVYSNTRLVFMSVCPIEKGFFWGQMTDSGEKHPFLLEAMRLASGLTFLEGGLNVLRGDGKAALTSATRILANRGPLRMFFQKVFLRYGLKRITFLASDVYDYWAEFLLEYEYFRAHSGKTETGTVRWQKDGKEMSTDVTGRYHFVRNKAHLASLIEDTGDVAMILTIEGAYVFSIAPNGRPVHEDLMFDRIRTLKQLEFPLFFLTIAHHFDNGICGHAHSVPDAARLVMDQSTRLNGGFERQNDLGMRVVRALLELDANLNDLGGRRIHIDCKHLSAQARKEYYDEVIRPYNAKNADTTIPVFFSHAAYSGIASIDQLIRDVDLEDDHFHSPPFYAWNINVSDDDMRMVWESYGLVGLVFDQRVCGVPGRQKVPDGKWGDLVLRHIFAMVDVVMADGSYSKAERKRVWDCISIGSDFDGMIDPLSRYATVLDFDTFAEDLRENLTLYAHTRMIDDIGVDELVEKICWKNAYAFAQRFFPDA